MKLFYRKLGQGKPLIILHGLLGSGDGWLPFAKMFSNSFEVYLPDLRNHGHSPHHIDMSYEVMGCDVLEFLDTHGIESAIIMGHSMGGKVAMDFALSNSGRVERLIIADIGIKPFEMNHIPYFEFLKNIELKGFVSRQDLQVFLMEELKDSRIVQHVLKNINRNPHNEFAWRVNIDAINSNLINILSGIVSNNTYNKPCLFIRGALSDYIKDEDLEGLKEKFPSLQLATVEKAGHWLHVDNLAGFIDRVGEFIVGV